MDTGEEAPVAELVLGGVGGEAAADEVAGRFGGAKGVVGVLLGQAGAPGDVGGGERPEALGVAAYESEPRRLAVFNLQEGVRGDGGAGNIGIGEEEADGGEVLGGEPEGAPFEAGAGRLGRRPPAR